MPSTLEPGGRAWHAVIMSDFHQDRADIIDTAVRYTWALDTKDIDVLDDVFTPDATAMLRGVECVGREQIKARIGGSILRLERTQHLVGNHQVSVNGDEGTHRCQLHGQHVVEGTQGGDNFIVGGYYEDRVVRTPDGWRIAHRLMQQTWTEGNPNVTKR
jgi:ketosteroid isomerase-like protein